MPRRRNVQLEPVERDDDESIDVAFTIRRNGPVNEYLKNQFYDLLVKSGEPLECPVCLESVLGCRNCFCLLVCGLVPRTEAICRIPLALGPREACLIGESPSYSGTLLWWRVGCLPLPPFGVG